MSTLFAQMKYGCNNTNKKYITVNTLSNTMEANKKLQIIFNR